MYDNNKSAMKTIMRLPNLKSIMTLLLQSNTKTQDWNEKLTHMGKFAS